MNVKDVCFKLLRAESEKAVETVIQSVPELADRGNWRPLDKRETNFNVTSNQASDGGKALTELMTNMVDAVLMRRAYEEGIDPKGKNAPRTMYEAVDRLVKNLRGGKLVNLDSKDPWLRNFAQKNLVVGITGARTRAEGLPCYTFVDNGEGQSPENFDTTFLSLSAGNKKNVPFVQGKYNMGSSGVLRYCGRCWFKLILSRRFDGTGPWGWTLVRRRPDATDSMPVAEYFVLPDGAIPRFDEDLISPFQTALGKQFGGVTLRTGTVVKLFDYMVGPRFQSFRGAREALNENLVETILPFRLLDFRQVPKSADAKAKAKKRGGDRAEGIDPRPFYGMEFLLLRSHREEGLDDEEDAAAAESEKLFVGTQNDPEIGEIVVSAIPLKSELPNWLKPQQTNNRVFHTVNGQVQYKQTRGYLSQSCKFPALKDRVIIIVDASGLNFSAHNEVWKGDREHISNTILGQRYATLVTEMIARSPSLIDLQDKVAESELEKATKAQSNSLFQRLVDQDETLAKLLTDRDPKVRLPAAGGKDGAQSGSGEFWGKPSPTFIRLEERFATKGLEVPVNRSRPVGARTDAENGYLNRTDNRGRVVLDDVVTTRFQVREYLHDGRLSLYLQPLEDVVDVGDVFSIKIALQDPGMPAAVETEEFQIRIVVKEKEPSTSKPKRSAAGGGPGAKKSGGQGESAPSRGLPPCVLLTRNGEEVKGYSIEQWPDDFGEHDGGLIVDSGENNEVIYKINYHNSYHISYRDKARGQVAKDAITEKYILGMRILILGYEHALRAVRSNGDNAQIAEFEDDFRRMAARGAASTVLALAENLPKIVDTASLASEDE